MDFKMYFCSYIIILMHVMDSIEGRDNGHVHELRPENARLLEHEPEQKPDMMVGMERLRPEEDESSTANSNSGHRNGIEDDRPKRILRVIMLPSKQHSIKQSEYPSHFPVVKFNYLRTSINEERDILRTTNDFIRPKDIVFKSYLKKMNLNGNMKPISRSASMIGYLGDTSKVEQQLTMASGLVSEENPMLGSLIGKSHSSHKADHLANLIRKIIASKYNNYMGGDQQALLDRNSKLGYSIQGNEKNADLKFHKNLQVAPQKKVINLSGIFPRDDDSHHLESREKDTTRSHDGILKYVGKVRSRRALERLPRLLGHVNVAVNRDRTKRASLDLTSLLPQITLEIGRSALKSDDSENAEDTSENERSGSNMDKTRSKRSTETLSRLLGSVDVTVNKGRAKRASLDLSNVLPTVSLEIGKSANSGSRADKKEIFRTRRASVDLSGILPSINLQVGKSERSVPDLEQSRFSPLLILFSDTKLDRTSTDDPYLHSMIRYFLKKLTKCDDLTDDDFELSRQSSKTLLDNPNK
ncbi:hypothetical protein LSTR_LSTR004959 [Laodelphax striatellus]|uniref:Uncharacterized protein n=1 Tax=Laodelphax striatellus TaxID=195883 RepID=A0A482XP20_LAOST|nr:hypothetical protein LSTR_LSTR004959 [Laodelphax striatellus]